MKTCGKKTKVYYLKCLLCFAVMILFGLLPPIGEITEAGMQILGIYIGTIMLWTMVDLIWPSLLGMILISFTGYMTFNEFISSGFGNITVIFVFMIAIFAFFITESGVSGCIAGFIVSRKIAKGRPWVTTALFVMASYVIACLISSVAATLVVLEIFSKFATETGYKKGDKYPILVMVCITFAAHMGGSVWTFRTPDAILVGYITEQGGHVPLIPYFLYSAFIGIGALILYLLFCKFFSKADMGPLWNECAAIERVPMTRYQKQLLGCSGVLLLLLILESMLPSSFMLGAFLKTMGTNGIVVLTLVVMMFFRIKESNRPFADLEKGTRAVPWKIFYVIIFNMPMAAILNDEALGISRSISNGVSELFAGNASRILFILILTILIVIFTTFIGNVPVCLMFYNVVAIFAPTLGVSTTALACIISLTSNASVILPGANPQSAILHGKKEWVETRDVVKYGILQSIAVIITVMIAYVLFLQNID